MFLPRIFILLLAVIVAAGAAEPLYEQFRPLASLPWAKPGVTREQVIRRLYREPNQMVRSALLEEYLKTVPAVDFARVFHLCLRLEEMDHPDELLKSLLRAWARIDAAAAWARCQELYEIILPQEPLDVDSWDTGVVVLNPRAVAASDFWPLSDDFAEAFSKGVAESGRPQAEKDRYIALQKAKSAAWWKAYDAAMKQLLYSDLRYSGKYDISSLPPPSTPEEIAQREAWQADREKSAREEKAHRQFLLEILTCPPAEIWARLVAAPPELWEDAILARALIRWMDGHVARGPEIVEAMLDLQDPHRVLRGISKVEPIPIEFLVEWALLDPTAFREWVWVKKGSETELRPGIRDKSMAVAQAMAHRDDLDPVLGWADDMEGDDTGIADRNVAAFHWARIDPGNALPWIWSGGGDRAYGEAAESVTAGRLSRGANVFRAAIAGIDASVFPIAEHTLSGIMEGWSDNDAAACARHGTRWNLRTGLFTKKRMIRLWTGYLNPDDGAVDDRHFGSLRIWAMRQPEQMRKWIRTEPLDEDVRRALLWFVDHAKGGFDLRKDGAPPVPLAPPQASEPTSKKP